MGDTLQDAPARPGLMQTVLDLQIRAAKATITAASSLYLPVPQFPLPQVIKLEIIQRGLKDEGEGNKKKSQQPTVKPKHNASGDLEKNLTKQTKTKGKAQFQGLLARR